MKKKNITIYLAVCLAFFVCAGEAQAISFTPPPFRDTSYLGKYVGQSIADPITVAAGTMKEVTVKIKNAGKATWSATGANYVSVYTVNPNYRASVFFGNGWISKSQPAKLTKNVKPGETAEVKIKFYAPAKAGDYTEHFYLAAENKTWIKSSYFYLKFKVTAATANSGGDATSNGEVEGDLGNSGAGTADEASEINKEYSADLIFLPARQLTIARGGDAVNFAVRYYNAGTANWQSYVWQEAGSYAVAGAARANFADVSWQSVNRIKSETVATPSGKPLQVNFVFRAPSKAGQYVARFQLMADNHSLDGGTLEIPITVLADAPYGYAEPTFASNRALVAQPNIRVGLYQATEPVQFRSPEDYLVYAGAAEKGILPANELATIDYKAGQYVFESTGLNFTSSEFVRLVPTDISSYFTLVNYDRRVSWKGNSNFNAYRGVFEYKYSPRKNVPYAVNELPLDLYVAGIAETSNGAALEYIKAILVAARSYAYYHINNGVPADQRTFDVYATTADQLYLGYNSEVLMPRVVQAQAATHGEMVTYSGTPVLTPYFGHSDGRTRLWSQVWGGADKPWLLPVECVYDQGESLFGHGVGMSAGDAAAHADKDGWTYNQILKYYYTGVEVEKIY